MPRETDLLGLAQMTRHTDRPVRPRMRTFNDSAHGAFAPEGWNWSQPPISFAVAEQGEALVSTEVPDMSEYFSITSGCVHLTLFGEDVTEDDDLKAELTAWESLGLESWEKIDDASSDAI